MSFLNLPWKFDDSGFTDPIRTAICARRIRLGPITIYQFQHVFSAKNHYGMNDERNEDT